MSRSGRWKLRPGSKSTMSARPPSLGRLFLESKGWLGPEPRDPILWERVYGMSWFGHAQDQSTLLFKGPLGFGHIGSRNQVTYTHRPHANDSCPRPLIFTPVIETCLVCCVWILFETFLNLLFDTHCSVLKPFCRLILTAQRWNLSKT